MVEFYWPVSGWLAASETLPGVVSIWHFQLAMLGVFPVSTS